MPYDASESPETFHAWLEDALAASEAGTEGAFATVDAAHGEACWEHALSGSASRA